MGEWLRQSRRLDGLSMPYGFATSSFGVYRLGNPYIREICSGQTYIGVGSILKLRVFADRREYGMARGTEIMRILVVDDDTAIADSLAVILNSSGYHAKAVHSAEEAIEESVLLAPDVLITDVIMAGISGIDLAIHITNTVPTCKIILFSGQAQTPELLHEAEENGYRFELLHKPVHPQVLLQRLSDYKASLNEMGGMEMRES